MPSTLRTVLTHLGALLCGVALMYLIYSPQAPTPAAKQPREVEIAAATSAAQREALKVEQDALPPEDLPQPAPSLITVHAVPTSSPKEVVTPELTIPAGKYAKYAGDWVYAKGADAKYKQGKLKIEAGRTDKPGVKSTPYNLTFFLITAQGKIFEGGCGFYETGTAYCQTDEGDIKKRTKKEGTVRLTQQANGELVVDVEEVGLSEHFKK